MFSDKKKAVVEAYNKGYRLINNEVVYKGNVRKLDCRAKKKSKYGVDVGCAYLSFGVRNDEGKRVQIFVHHLAAYQKFGNQFLETEGVVIHLDGDTTNNQLDNLALGDRTTVSKIRYNKPLVKNEVIK